MKTYKRSDRVRHLIQQEISQILQLEVKDPRVKFVTVTGLKLTDDLREAKVLISILGEADDRNAVLSGLHRATGYIRSELGRRLKLRYTPTVTFAIDDSWERQERILDLLDSIHHDDMPSSDVSYSDDLDGNVAIDENDDDDEIDDDDDDEGEFA